MFAASVCCLCVASSFLLQLSVLLRVVLWFGVFTHAAGALNIAIFEESSARLLSQPVMETSTCGTAEGTSSGNPSSSMNPETKRKGSAEAFERSEKRLRSTLNQVTLQPLSIMTVNMQFKPSFLNDPHKGTENLQKIIGQTQLPDIICIQEGMPDMDVWQNLKYKLVICAGTQGVAQSVAEMTYHKQEALKCYKKDQSHKLLCNQVYLRKDSQWEVKDFGVEQISSALELAGGGGRKTAQLAVRSMCWLTLGRTDFPRTAVCVMCTHLSGGRFEDQYFVQQLERERYSQIERCIDVFRRIRHRQADVDVGILVGDFNATEAYTVDAPFDALMDNKWLLAYDKEQIQATSSCGPFGDYMAVSKWVVTGRPQRVILSDQKVKGKQTAMEEPTTNRNAVITPFFLQSRVMRSSMPCRSDG